MIEYLLPKSSNGSLDAVLDLFADAPWGLPFNERVMNFVGTLSRRILSDRGFREYPELMAMAHWFRPASLHDLHRRFRAGEERERGTFLRRGVVLHIAPSNVDSVFIYSWLLSILCGNSNIARVSRRRSAQMQTFLSVTADVLQQNEFRGLADSNLVISYDHDAGITEKLSARCHLRVIWGGDNTVQQIRAIPLPPLATEIAFANRFSLAVIRADAVLALDKAGLDTLTHGFYNDSFWFNQQACSSPRSVIWIGSMDSTRLARASFWSALADKVIRRRPENHPAFVMDRTTTLFRLAFGHPFAHAETKPGELPSRIFVPELSEEDRYVHDGNGLFIELQRLALEEIIPIFSSRDQTIASFGFTSSDWLALIPSLPPHAADRIVPIGEALAFSSVWDGANLLRTFTRELRIF